MSPTPADVPYHHLVHQLDLCMLAYQAYNQTLVWPLDPWYERWSRIGSDRRDNMLSVTHEFVIDREPYRGPGSTRPGWPTNPTLDPVISRYDTIVPWRPCVTHDGYFYRLFFPPQSITKRIGSVHVCQFQEPPWATSGKGERDEPNWPRAPAIRELPGSPAAQHEPHDVLYAFEGGTGSVEGRPGAWGIAGIVLGRAGPGGSYDVHIAFRGSQSGSAYRAAYLGLFHEAGNPDWVTDTEGFKMVADPRVCSQGAVLRGIRDATFSAMDPLLACLSDLHSRFGRPPTSVHVTGHSLGGALATQFAAAIALGLLGVQLGEPLRSWPWSGLELTTFGSPKVGDGEFAAAFDASVSAQRVWVAGDPITAFPTNTHVGRALELLTAVTGTQTHEPALIRSSLIERLVSDGEDMRGVPREPHEQPWRAIESLAEVFSAGEQLGFAPGELFHAAFDEATADFVTLAGRVIENRSSYKISFTKSREELRDRRLRLERQFASSTSSVEELGERVRSLAGVQPSSGVEDHLRRVLIVREAKAHEWRLADLIMNVSVARALTG